jgi:thiamine pyrophosphokinase
MPMGVCRGIVTKGLKYPLRNESLALGVREVSSNEAIGRSVRISVKHGSLLLFKIHPSVRS